MAKDKSRPQTFESVLDILDTPSELIERPKPLPRGTYLTVLQGQPDFGKSSVKQTDYVEFVHKITEPGPDVDEDELVAFLTLPNGKMKSLRDTTVKNQFYLTDASAFMLKDFCKMLGIDVGPGTQPRQWIAETPGRRCLVHIRHKPWLSGGGVSANIDRVMKAE